MESEFPRTCSRGSSIPRVEMKLDPGRGEGKGRNSRDRIRKGKYGGGGRKAEAREGKSYDFSFFETSRGKISTEGISIRVLTEFLYLKRLSIRVKLI